MTPQEVLALPVEGESGASTVGGFLAAVLTESWKESKRVFGASDWRWEAYDALAAAGLIEGERADDGFWRTLDTAAGDRIMREAIVTLGGPA